MRCAQCGMPLSPSRTHCPRCGAATTNKPRARQEQTADGFFPASGTQYQGGPWQNPDQPEMPAPVQQVSFPSTPEAHGYNTPMSGNAEPPLSAPPGPIYQQSPWQPQVAQLGVAPTQTKQPYSIKTGFTVASLCVTMGALLLIFVFVMAQSLPPEKNATTQTTSTGTATPDTSSTPTTTEATPTKEATKPTANAEGKQYIDKVLMASSVTTKAEPQQITADFSNGQAIYVTMLLYKKAYSGYICLNWYLNDQLIYFNSYPANPGHNLPDSRAYFYINPAQGTQGSGYVDVAWADNPNCFNKILSQHATFTVK